MVPSTRPVADTTQTATSFFACASSIPRRGAHTSRKNIHDGEKEKMGCVQPPAPGTQAENGSLSPTAGAESGARSRGGRPPSSTPSQTRKRSCWTRKQVTEGPAACRTAPTEDEQPGLFLSLQSCSGSHGSSGCEASWEGGGATRGESLRPRVWGQSASWLLPALPIWVPGVVPALPLTFLQKAVFFF